MKKRDLILAILIFFSGLRICAAEGFSPFLGSVTENEINIRTDSTPSAALIQKVNKGVYLDVIFELYDWYKIKLPKTAPSYVKKDLIEPLSEKAGKVIKDRINIRLGPGETTPIIGKANRDEILTIVATQGDWYRIEPVDNSFGWINKRFVTKAAVPAPKPLAKALATVPAKAQAPAASSAPATLAPSLQQEVTSGTFISIEGIVKPYGKIFRRKATHKLIHKDDTFLLKGSSKKTLDALNYHAVKVQGKVVTDDTRYPIIEIEKIEALD